MAMLNNQRVLRIHPEITLNNPWENLGIYGGFTQKEHEEHYFTPENSRVFLTKQSPMFGGSSDAKSSWLGTIVLMGQPSCRTY